MPGLDHCKDKLTSLLWGDCGRIELGEKIRNSGNEMLYLKYLLDFQWRYWTDSWTQRCGIHTRDIYLGVVRI